MLSSAGLWQAWLSIISQLKADSCEHGMTRPRHLRLSNPPGRSLQHSAPEPRACFNRKGPNPPARLACTQKEVAECRTTGRPAASGRPCARLPVQLLHPGRGHLPQIRAAGKEKGRGKKGRNSRLRVPGRIHTNSPTPFSSIPGPRITLVPVRKAIMLAVILASVSTCRHRGPGLRLSTRLRSCWWSDGVFDD